MAASPIISAHARTPLPAPHEAAPTPAPARAARPREPWIDAAKAVCIVLVVLHHVTSKQLGWWPWPTDAAPIIDTWRALSDALRPIRMPLFFLLSGYVVVRWMQRPLGRFLVERVLRPWWLFTAWLAVHGVWWWLIEPIDNVNLVPAWRDVPLELVWASSGLWYLSALATYALVVRATMRVPAPLVLGVLALTAVAAQVWVDPITQGNRAAVLANVVFFACGTRASGVVDRLVRATRRSTALAWLLASGFAGAISLTASLGIDAWHGMSVVLAALGVGAGVAVMVRASDRSVRIQRLGATLGPRTLPIYVLHVLLLAGVDHALRAAGVDRWIAGGETGAVLVVAVVYPLAITAALVAACCMLHAVLAPRAPWLFNLPWRARFRTARRAAR